MRVFGVEDDYLYYLGLVERFKTQHLFDLFHYCLMPNHVHMLIRTKSKTDFATFMKQINLAYMYYYKKKYGWSGHFWQGRYKSQTVGKDAYFIQCGKYIELNPVRAGLVNRPDEWRFSSYRSYTQGFDDPLLSEDPFFEGLGSSTAQRHLEYQHMVIYDFIKQSYKLPVWGTSNQRHNEQQKRSRIFNRRTSRYK